MKEIFLHILWQLTIRSERDIKNTAFEKTFCKKEHVFFKNKHS